MLAAEAEAMTAKWHNTDMIRTDQANLICSEQSIVKAKTIQLFTNITIRYETLASGF